MKLAILDLYDGAPNQGMRAIKAIINRFNDLTIEVFDVRSKAEIPSTDFDIYISTGGPGNPLDGDGVWDKKYFELLQALWDWNQREDIPKKYVFLICHSFQMACQYFGIAKITKRKSMSFGVFPTHKTVAGEQEWLFEALPTPFHVADFRDWQMVEPDYERIESLDAKVLALEKIRPHVDLERAIMAVRFSEEFFGTQFHPEADPEGMLVHFLDDKRREHVINKYGEEKYFSMLADLQDADKIPLTHDTILPRFLANAIEVTKNASLMV